LLKGYDILKIQKEKETLQTGKENIMLEMICRIPDSIGWAIVGALAMLCAVMLVKLGKMFVQMWKDYHEDEAEEAENFA
jgi:hypothetical protein